MSTVTRQPSAPRLAALHNIRLWAVVRSGGPTRSNLRPFLLSVIVFRDHYPIARSKGVLQKRKGDSL
jgi:hypothetical protein